MKVSCESVFSPPPRRCNTHNKTTSLSNRANVDGPPIDYYKTVIGIPFLDFVIMDLKTRFGPEQLKVANLLTLKPSIMKCKSCDEIWHDLKDGVDHFQRFFPDGGRALQQEIPVILNVLNSKDRKDLASETLSSFFVKISTVFKETKLLLQLVLTFPITSNEAVVIIL